MWKYTDTNNDGVADKKELFTTNFGRAGNVEHQQAGLFWAMDNWLYSTVNAFRAALDAERRRSGNRPAPNGAQWGATQDNYGKVWFQGGASGMPGTSSSRSTTATSTCPDQSEPDLNIMWGAPILIARHAGRPAVGSACPTARSTARRPPPATTSSAATACRRTSSATTSTAKRSAGSSAACGR